MATQSTFSMSQHGRTEPFDLQVGRGQIPYHTSISLFGYQPNIGNTAICIWEQPSAYNFPVAAATCNVASTTSDTCSVLIQGLDANYSSISETVVLNGASNVVTTNSYFRINSMVCISGSNTGVVTAKQGSNVVVQMNANIGKSQNAWYTVPANSTFYLTRAQVFSTAGLQAGTSQIPNIYQVQASNAVTNANLTVLQTPFVGNFSAVRISPFPYASTTDIQFQVKTISGSSNTTVGIIVEGYTIANNGTSAGY
jgi:hypothetical protein